LSTLRVSTVVDEVEDASRRQTVRVLITHPSLERPGGVANYYQIMQPHLSPLADFFTIGSRTENESRVASAARIVKDAVGLVRALRAKPYSLVHLNPSLQPGALVRDGISLLIAKAFGKKVVVFVRGWDLDFELQLRRRYLRLFRSVYFRADAFIVLASAFRDHLVSMGLNSPVYSGTTVVDDAVFSAARKQADNKKFGSQRPDCNILFLARVERSKGIYEVLKAYSLLKARHPATTLTVAGDGSELGKAKEFVQNHGLRNVKFLGFVSGCAKDAAFGESDVYVFPSSHGEGMPNSVLEAMAYGLPVVTRPVGGVPDFFVDGRMGYMTDSVAPERLAEALGSLVADRELRLEMGKHNRRYAWERFRASIVAERLQAIYQEVVGEPTRPLSETS
jgi:glycosyltransferase involved in cell wall biosynthesis